MSKGRVLYLDAAKVLTVCLVVYLHFICMKVYLNELLLQLRMPLFFFASGFFAVKAMTLDLHAFMSKKFLRLMYLYVVWSVLLFVLLEVWVTLAKGGSPAFGQLPEILWEPMKKVWFLYALALVYLVAYLTRAVPRHILLGAAFVVYFFPKFVFVDRTGCDFSTRMCRLTPFFLLSLRYGDVIRPLIEKRTIVGQSRALLPMQARRRMLHSRRFLTSPQALLACLESSTLSPALKRLGLCKPLDRWET
jgi:uncharacterized membrane protein YcfT